MNTTFYLLLAVVGTEFIYENELTPFHKGNRWFEDIKVKSFLSLPFLFYFIFFCMLFICFVYKKAAAGGRWKGGGGEVKKVRIIVEMEKCCDYLKQFSPLPLTSIFPSFSISWVRKGFFFCCCLLLIMKNGKVEGFFYLNFFSLILLGEWDFNFSFFSFYSWEKKII